MDNNDINYELLYNDAIHNGLIKKTLLQIEGENLSVHIVLSFLTSFPKVVLPDYLKKLYPEEITIVLQHQFKNLKVSVDFFSVALSFNGIDENIVVPFKAITSYIDLYKSFKISLYKNVIIKHKNSIISDSNNDESSKISTDKKNNIIYLDKWKKPS